MSLRAYLSDLPHTDLIEFSDEISLELSVSQILRNNRTKTVLFKNIKESPFPLVGNLLTTRAQLRSLFSNSALHQSFCNAINNPIKPSLVENSSTFYNQIPVDLLKLPIPRFFPSDGGRYLTSGIVLAQFPNGEVNASIHRIMIINRKKGVIRIVPRDLYHIYNHNKQRGDDTPIAIVVGYHPILALASSTPQPFGHSELNIANALLNNTLTLAKSPEYNIPIPTDVEFLLEGKILVDEEHEEGPFVDITGTMDTVRRQPVIEIDAVFHRDNPIFQTIVPAYDEHYILMGFPREARIFDFVSNVVPIVYDVRLTPGSCGWLHAVISIEPSQYGDGKNAALAAFAAHPSLKWCTIVNNDININNSRDVEWATITRVGEGDIIVINKTRGSSLDPARNTSDNTSIKVIIDATIKGKEEKANFKRVT